jgi:hypothetical protein
VLSEYDDDDDDDDFSWLSSPIYYHSQSLPFPPPVFGGVPFLPWTKVKVPRSHCPAPVKKAFVVAS